MINKQFVRKILIAGVAVGSSPVPANSKCDQICRASELPIYMSKDDCKIRDQSEQLCPTRVGIIESTFGAVRRRVWEAMDKCTEYEKQAEDVLKKGQDQASSMYKYLSQDADDMTRAGVIGLGTLTGLVLGLRGGIFRKAFYSGLGAYGMCAVCYPNQTADYTRQAIKESRKYATIGYNFVYGVKKDDIPLPNLPKLPSSMNEVWDIAGSIGKSASSLITGKAAKEEQEAKIAEKLKEQVPSSDDVIKKSHSKAHESCHCPVGACLGKHEKEAKKD